MKQNKLWKRLLSLALAVVLMVPAMSVSAKVEMKSVLEEDFNDASYPKEIRTIGNDAELSVVDGVLKVDASKSSGVRAAWVSVKAGKAYTISCDIKVDSVSSIQVLAESWYETEEVEGTNWSGIQELDVVYQGTEFVRKTYTYTVPADVERNYMQFILMEAHDQNETVFYVDNFVIEEVQEIPNLVTNGSFGDAAADVTGWDVEVSREETKVEKTETVLYSRNFDSDSALGFFRWNINNSTTEITNVDGDNAIAFKKGGNKYITYYGTPFEANTTYTVSCKVKASADTYFRVLYDIAGGPCDHKTVGTEWTDYSFTFTTEVANEQPILYFGILDETDNTIYIDDVEIKSVSETVITEEVMTDLYSRDFDADYEKQFFNWNINNSNTEITNVDGDNAIAFRKGVNKYITYYGTPIEANTTYTVSCKVKASANTSFRVLYEIAGYPCDHKTVGTEWTDYSFTFTPEASNPQPILYFGIMDDSDNTIYIDDVKIQKVEVQPAKEPTDGVGAFGKEGYGLKLTDDTALTNVVANNATSYEFSFWLKVDEASSASVVVNGTKTIATSQTTNGEWVKHSGEFTIEGGATSFGIVSEGTVYVDEIELYAHVHDVWPVDAKEATCSENGIAAHFMCPLCGVHFADAEGLEVITEEDYVIIAAHDIYPVEAKEATCKEDGQAAHFECDVCKKHFADVNGTEEITEEDYVIPAGHTSVNVPKKDATCTENGHQAGTKCSVCDEPLSGLDVIEKGHKAVKLPAVAAQVGKTGLTEGSKCSVCRKVLKAQTKTPALKLAKPKASKITSLTAGKKKLTVKFKKISGVTRYEIQIATKKNMKSGLKTYKVSKASDMKNGKYVVKSLKAKATYYVRICTVKTVNGVTARSAWSAVKKMKTK